MNGKLFVYLEYARMQFIWALILAMKWIDADRAVIASTLPILVVGISVCLGKIKLTAVGTLGFYWLLVLIYYGAACN